MAPGLRLRRRATAIAGLLVGVAAVGNAATLVGGAQTIRTSVTQLAPRLTALEIARPLAHPDYRPERGLEPQVIAGDYFAAIDAFGSPAPSPEQLAARPAGERAAADQVLRELVPPRIVPVRIGHGRACRTVEPPSEVPVDSRGVIVAPARGDTVVLRQRRFGDAPNPDPVGTVRGPARVTYPRDSGGRPWTVQLTAARRVAVCG